MNPLETNRELAAIPQTGLYFTVSDYDREKQGHRPSGPYHVYKLFFHDSITGGEHVPNHESSACGSFPVDDLPELSTCRLLVKQILHFHRLCKTD
ncbi:MAG: hypothetical protein F6K19_47305 [Cyanothece sp. SIO1E1]|nr:hypothetical protein [Cyanothece sp. SIO1E1]